MHWSGHFEGNFARDGIQDVVFADGDVFQALGFPLIGDPSREFVVARGTGGMRFEGEGAVELRNSLR